MKYILTSQTNLPLVRKIRILLRASRIGVVEFPRATVPAHIHLVREERIKSENTPSAVAQNLCIGISPQEEMRHKRLTKDETRHFGIWRIVEQEVQRMFRYTLFALPFVSIDVNRQPCDGFCENANTGVDRRCLHRGSLIDRLARRRLPKQKGQTAKMILGLVPRTEEFAK